VKSIHQVQNAEFICPIHLVSSMTIIEDATRE